MMEFTQIFANIIKRIKKEEVRTLANAANSDSRRIVIIDRKRKVALQKMPMFVINSDLDYFVVYNNNNNSKFVNNSINSYVLNDFASDLRLGLSIDYNVSCPPNNEEQVALALFDPDGDTPGKVFEACVIRCIDRIWEEEFQPEQPTSESALETFCKNGMNNLEKLRTRLEWKLSALTGLKVKLRLTLENRRNLDAIPIDDTLRLLFTNSPETFDARYSAHITVDSSKGIVAMLYPPVQHELEAKVKQRIIDFIHQNIKLEELVYEFDTSVYHQVCTELNGTLAKYGRQIEALSIKTVKDLRMPSGITMKYDVEADVISHEHIVINNDLEVEPDRSKLVIFRRTGIKDQVDLAKHLETSLKNIVRKCMFGKKYLDVLLKFNDIQQEIEKAMNEEAESFGYRIKLITSTPNLPPIIWKNRGFDIETNVPPVDFATREDNIKVKLNVFVKGKLRDLNRVEHYLVTKDNVPDIIRIRIVDYLTNKIHEITPQDYYSNFDFPMTMGRTVPLKTEFQEEIRDLLASEFGVSDISVIAKSLQTEITDRITRLQRSTGKFSIEVISLQDVNGTIPINIEFNVLGVAPEKWHIFHVRERDIEQVEELLRKNLKSDLASLHTEDIAWVNLEDRENLFRQLKRRAEWIAEEQCGLRIELSLISRDLTKQEQLWYGVRDLDVEDKAKQVKADMANRTAIEGIKAERKMQTIKEKEEQLAAIRKLITQLSTLAGDEDEIAEQEARAKKLEEEIYTLNQALSTEFVPSERNIDSLAPSYNRKAKKKKADLSILEAKPKQSDKE